MYAADIRFKQKCAASLFSLMLAARFALPVLGQGAAVGHQARSATPTPQWGQDAPSDQDVVMPTFWEASPTFEVHPPTPVFFTPTPGDPLPTGEDGQPTVTDQTATPTGEITTPFDTTLTPGSSQTGTPSPTHEPAPPVVNSIEIIEVSTGFNPNSFTPMQQYRVKVDVTDPNGIGSLEYLVFKLWFDPTGGAYASTDFDAASGKDGATSCVITWHRGSNKISMAPDWSSWNISDDALPALDKLADPNYTQHSFEFTVSVGKVARQTTEPGLWQAGALAKDNTGQSSFIPFMESGMPGLPMDWYGEVMIPRDEKMNWGKVLPGIGFDDPRAAYEMNTHVTVVANGPYNLAVKTVPVWNAEGGLSMRMDEYLKKPDTFALRAFIGKVAHPAKEALLLDKNSFAVDIGSSPAGTGEAGYTVKNIYFYLSLSQKISGTGSYSGPINFIVHN